MSGRRRVPKVGSGAGGMAAGFAVTGILTALLVATANLDGNPVQSLGIAAPRQHSAVIEPGGTIEPGATESQEEVGRLSAMAQTAEPRRPEPSTAATPPPSESPRPAPSLPSQRPAPTQSAPPPARHDLSDVAARVQQYARSRATVFTGMDIDSRNGRLVVWRKPDSGFDAQVRSIAGGTPVDLRSAPRSLSELQTLQRQVINFGSANNISIVSIKLPHDGVALTVGVSSNLSTGRSALTRQFGTSVKVVADTWADTL